MTIIIDMYASAIIGRIQEVVKWEWLDGNGREWKLQFAISSHRKISSPSVVSTSASPGTSADSDTLDCHSPPAKKRRVFDFKHLCDPEDDHQQSRNELAEKMLTRMGGNGNNQWE